MSTLIVSPHTDDAIFSLGNYMRLITDITILSIFSGIPPLSLDHKQYKKHVQLRHEHDIACHMYLANVINLDFLDDVFEPRPSKSELTKAVKEYIYNYEHVLIPLGIGHPDHVLLREIFDDITDRPFMYYKDLPYAEMYPHRFNAVRSNINPQQATKIFHNEGGIKERAVRAYDSQIQNDHILGELFVTEEIYA